MDYDLLYALMDRAARELPTTQLKHWDDPSLMDENDRYLLSVYNQMRRELPIVPGINKCSPGTGQRHHDARGSVWVYSKTDGAVVHWCNEASGEIDLQKDDEDETLDPEAIR